MGYYAKIVRELRERHGLTQVELASRLNVTHSFVNQIENDRREPSLKMGAKIRALAAKLKSSDSKAGGVSAKYRRTTKKENIGKNSAMVPISEESLNALLDERDALKNKYLAALEKITTLQDENAALKMELRKQKK